jgi:hypothetical protein
MKVYVATIMYENTRDSWEKEQPIIGVFMSKLDAINALHKALLKHVSTSSKGLAQLAKDMTYEELTVLALLWDEIFPEDEYDVDLDKVRVYWTAEPHIVESTISPSKVIKKTATGRTQHYKVTATKKLSRISKKQYKK